MHPGMLLSQVPFDCDGKVYAVKFQTDQLFEMVVAESLAVCLLLIKHVLNMF